MPPRASAFLSKITKKALLTIHFLSSAIVIVAREIVLFLKKARISMIIAGKLLLTCSGFHIGPMCSGSSHLIRQGSQA